MSACCWDASENRNLYFAYAYFILRPKVSPGYVCGTQPEIPSGLNLRSLLLFKLGFRLGLGPLFRANVSPTLGMNEDAFITLGAITFPEMYAQRWVPKIALVSSLTLAIFK